MVNNLIQQGLQKHGAGFIDEAKSLYEQALALNPKDPDALHLLGLTALQSGFADKAAELIRKALIIQPKNWAFQANLAAALVELGQLDGALVAFRSAAKLNPNEPQFKMGVANCLALSGDLAAAEAQLRSITHRHSGYALAWFNLGNVVRDLNRVTEAVECYERAISADSALPDAHNNLGNVLHTLGRLEDAEHAYRKELTLNPRNATARCNLASALIDRGCFADAEAECRQVIADEPNAAIAYSFLGAAIGHQGRLREALDFHRKAVALDQNSVRTLMALGSALNEIGAAAEGLPLLERALALAPNMWEAHFSLAIVKLAVGEFQEGWREFLYRSTRERFMKLYPDVKLSFALPETLAGQHVCVLREQGLGDQIFFLRFAAEIKARGARITYRSTPKIASMLARVASIDRVIPDTEPIPTADHVLLVGDLPVALASGQLPPTARESNSIQLPPPLALTPLAHQLTAIAARLARLGPPPYMGITWRGGTAPEQQTSGMSWMLFKQIPLRELGEALQGVQGTFLALQRNPEAREIEQLSGFLGKPLHDLTALNEDLEAMLALLALIDDYVGVSNTNMHLRAGAGKTARVLVPCPAEWRWMAQGEESPWFRGFRIYRQDPDGGWRAALERLRNDLVARDCVR